MIIKSLEMNNFRQFTGIQKIEFSTDPERNVTVLIGVNTSGKTTIIRAFEWCLYGKNGFEDPVLLNSDVRANMHEGDTKTTSVSVCFIHNETEYTLVRSAKYTCTGRFMDGDGVNVSLGNKPEEDVVLEYLLKDGQTKTNVEKSNIAESINRVLPADLSDYFFFGGERISSIANRTDLSKSVRGLMRLDVLENARDHVREVSKKFNNMIDTSGDESAQAARNALESNKKKRDLLLEKLENVKNERDYWNDKEHEYSAKLSSSDIQQVQYAKQQRDRIRLLIQKEEERLAAAKKAVVSAFNNRAFAFFGTPQIKKSLDLLEKYKDMTEGIPSMEQDAIDFLIKRGTCICGTKLVRDTQPYNTLVAERKKLPPEQIGTIVSGYKRIAEGYLAGSEEYCENVTNKYKEYREILRHIGQLHDDEDAATAQIKDDVDAKAIETLRNDALNKYNDASAEYDQIQSEIGKCDNNIENCEKTIKKYATNSDKNKKVSRYIAYTDEVLNWLIETYSAKEDTVRDELQKRVNDNFSKMYHGERSIIIDDKYRVKYRDVKTEESDGLKAVKSFAFIASLVSMAKDKILDDEKLNLGQVYPIVMDAPFSNVDEIHINNICKILPKTANQVIMAVMQKDWEFAAGNLNQYVGMSYSITKDRDVDGKEIDTSSHIRKEN